MKPLLFALLGVCCIHAAETSVQVTPLPVRPVRAPEAPRLKVLPPGQTGVTHLNRFDDPRMWGDRFREYTLGALETGVAVADFDQDGRPDLFVVSKTGPCALYRQTAPFRFEEVTAQAGVACDQPALAGKTGATVVDLNQDGLPDLYVCRNDAPNLLFINQGGLRFTECAKAWGLDLQDASVHASFADHDGDGDLDAYLVTNILDFSKSPQGRRDYLLRNDGQGRFSDVSKEAGIWGLTQGHSALWFDANQDGWPDLYVANDFETPDRFYLNRGDGTFADVVDQRLPHVTYFSMGADAGDLNNDGLVDFLVADMRDRTRKEYMGGMEEIGRGIWELERVSSLIPQYMWNAVYLNTGTARYQEAAHLLGMQATGWTWAARLADLDEDGRLDALFTTGMIRNFVDPDLVDKQNLAPSLAARAAVWKNAPVRRDPLLLYRNQGGLSFEECAKAWGLEHKGVLFGAALADLDADGDLDLVLANQEGAPLLVRNDSYEGSRLLVRLQGQAPNREALGAELRLETSSGVQVRQVYTERGIVSSEPAQVHFGLPAGESISRLTIFWPDGQTQVLEQPPKDVLLTVSQPAPLQKRPPSRSLVSLPASPLYREKAETLGLSFKAQARPVDEFRKQRLLPRRLALTAPALATADVNQDGLADLFLSGVGGQPGRLYLGRAQGDFELAPSQPWEEAVANDQGAAVFVQANQDGRPDLFVAGASVDLEPGAPANRARLYLNEGGGRFSPAPESWLPGQTPCSVSVSVADLDGDGKQDLFIGGRFVPGAWPRLPESHLYLNRGDHFEERTEQLAPGLRNVGLVTASVWADLTQDGLPDLLLVTEWGSPRLFVNQKGRLVDQSREAGLLSHTGWWCGLAVADLNADGLPDLVAGNQGLNTKYRASPRSLAVLLAGDLDDSGRTQLLEAAYDEDGRLYPLRGRSKLAYSFPWLPRRFNTFAAFASASVEELFGAERLAGVQRLEAVELASGIFWQQPDARFRFEPLPREAQLAPLRVLLPGDYDADGVPDLLVAGNFHGPEPVTGRFDGGVGLLLKGGAGGSLVPQLPARSGFLIPGEACAGLRLPAFSSGTQPRIVVTQGRDRLLLFEALDPQRP